MADVEIGPEDIDSDVGVGSDSDVGSDVESDAESVNNMDVALGLCNCKPYHLCNYCQVSGYDKKAWWAGHARYDALMKLLGGRIMSRYGQFQLPKDIVQIIFGYGYHLALAVPTEFYRMQNVLVPTQRVFECEFSYVALCVPYNAIPSGAEVCDHVKWGWPGEQKERFRYMNSLSDSIWEWKRRAPTVRVVAMSHLGAQQYQQHLGQDALACVRA